MSTGLAVACQRYSEGLDIRAGRLMAILCFVLGFQMSSTQDYDVIQVSYNPWTGVVRQVRTEYIFSWGSGYYRGHTWLTTLDGGGRLCALALAGYANPYGVRLCGPVN